MTSWVKLAILILVFGVIVPFALSFTVSFYVQRVGEERMELAVDVEVVQAEYDTDAGNGGVVIMDTHELKSAVRESFRKQMQLDGKLENNLMKDSNLVVNVEHNEEGTAIIECLFTTHVKIMLTNQSKEVQIIRKVPVETEFN